MQFDSLAILFVFVGNAASILLLIYMLFRILRQTEATHTLLVGGTKDLIDAGKRLRDSMKSADRLVDRLQDINSHTDSRQDTGNVETEEHFRKIESMIQDLSGSKFQDHGRFLEDVKGLLDSFKSVKNEGLGEWREANQSKLDTAIAQRNRMAAEMEAVKARLDDSNKIIQDLRRTVRLAEAAGQSAEALRASLEQHQQLLARAKERAQASETKLAALNREMELIQAEAGRADIGKDGAATNALRRQLEAIKRERDSLDGQLARLKEAMQRTLIEKDFIEEKLLDLDAATGRLTPAAAPEGAEPVPQASGEAAAPTAPTANTSAAAAPAA